MSERERIGRLVDRFAQAPLIVPSGDDAAVAAPGGAVTVTSIDAVVDGVHFVLGAWPEQAIGYKAVTAALSDLAAMGARAGEIYVATGVPEGFGEDRFDRLAEGIAAAAEDHGAHVGGGDLVRSEALWLSVTVVGYADSAESVVTRGGARPGDVVVLTGHLGGSARALELIERGVTDDEVAVRKQFSPQPRLAAGVALAASGARAMIDVSDGLARDAGHLANAGGVGLEIELARIPLADGVEDAVYAASSGEEYELLAVLPADRAAEAQRAVAATGIELSQIGRVVEGSDAVLRDAAGRDVEIGGFDHFD